MAQISEKWQITVGKNKHILSGIERDFLLANQDKRFVQFRDLVINPAFVQDMVLIERINNQQIEAPAEVEFTEAQLKRNRELIAKGKKELLLKIKDGKVLI